MIFPTILKCSLLILFFVNLPRLVVADSAPNSDQDFSQIEYFGSHSNGDEYFKGKITNFVTFHPHWVKSYENDIQSNSDITITVLTNSWL